MHANVPLMFYASRPFALCSHPHTSLVVPSPRALTAHCSCSGKSGALLRQSCELDLSEEPVLEV